VTVASGAGLVHRGVGVLDEFDVSALSPSQTTIPTLARCSSLDPIERKRLGQCLEKSIRYHFGLGGRGQSLGQVQELVTPETAQRVRRAGDLLERWQGLRAVGRRPSGRTHHSLLEVIEVQQQHGTEFSFAGDPRAGLVEPIIEEGPVGEPRERVVQRLVGKLGGERPLLGDVAHRGDEVECRAALVAGRTDRHFDDTDSPSCAGSACRSDPGLISPDLMRR